MRSFVYLMIFFSASIASAATKLQVKTQADYFRNAKQRALGQTSAQSWQGGVHAAALVGGEATIGVGEVVHNGRKTMHLIISPTLSAGFQLGVGGGTSHTKYDPARQAKQMIPVVETGTTRIEDTAFTAKSPLFAQEISQDGATATTHDAKRVYTETAGTDVGIGGRMLTTDARFRIKIPFFHGKTRRLRLAEKGERLVEKMKAQVDAGDIFAADVTHEQIKKIRDKLESLPSY